MPVRIGINYGNALLATRPAADGVPGGIVADMGRELGRALGERVEWIPYDSASAMADAAARAEWDVAFLAPDPARAALISFTEPYVDIEATYLVPAGSPIRSIDEVDRPGIRIATWERSAYDLYLRRAIRHAQLIGAAGIDASIARFGDERLDVLAGLRPLLLDIVDTMPGARILDGRFTAIRQAIGVVSGRDRTPIDAFVREAKSSGLVARLVERNGMRGRLAPA